MHQVLKIVEVQLQIFENLMLMCEEPTVARLARTCRAFEETALDLLWEVQRDLWPLLECVLPAAMMQQVRVGEMSHRIFIVRPSCLSMSFIFGMTSRTANSPFMHRETFFQTRSHACIGIHIESRSSVTPAIGSRDGRIAIPWTKSHSPRFLTPLHESFLTFGGYNGRSLVLGKIAPLIYHTFSAQNWNSSNSRLSPRVR